jgi:predicted MFS family arabinose efflux permease
MDQQGGASRGYSNYVLVILSLGMMLSYVDRQLMSVLMSPIKAELHLSDTELGFLSGLAFALFYAFCAIPLARLADRSSRRRIMTASLCFWSVATMLGGVVQNFLHLLLVRIGVGVGEAGYTPAVYSTLADYFGPERRQMAAGLMNAGTQIGIVASLILGGLIAPVYGWRAAFVAAGAPGLIVAALIYFTVREPKRTAVQDSDAAASQRPLGESLALLWSCRSYRFIVITSAFHGFSTFALTVWMPSFLERSHGMPLSTVGPVLAAATICGALGSVAGGTFGDRLTRRDVRYPLFMAAAAYVAAIPLIVAALWLQTPPIAIICYGAFLFLLTLPHGPIYALCLGSVPGEVRALGISVLMFVVSFTGFGLGPLATGIASDLLTASGSAQPLRLAMTIMSVSLIAPAFFALVTARHHRRDTDAANIGLSVPATA